MASKKLQAIFHGHVQGVGFRYTAQRIANSFDVTGYVRNRADGTVELVAEGEEKELNELLDIIKERMERYIRDVNIAWAVPEGKWAEFKVTF